MTAFTVDGFVTMEHAAVACGVHRDAVYRAVRLKRVEASRVAMRIGRQRRPRLMVRLDEVREFFGKAWLVEERSEQTPKA